MSILSGNAIRDALKSGALSLDPFVDEHINPASYDMTLGPQGAVYHDDILDPTRPNPTNTFEWGSGFILEPGRLYLGHTAERVSAGTYVAVVDGKSSLGRLGIGVHMTAGFIDPGYSGQVTLEISCVQRVKLRAGMRIAQIRFHKMVGEGPMYQETGRYVGENAEGAVPSLFWKGHTRVP